LVSNFHHGPASFYPHFGFLFRSVVFLLPKEKRKNTAKETKACADRKMELAKRVVKMKEEVEHGKTIGRPPTFISFLKKKKKCWGDHEFLLCAHLVSFRFTCGQAISFTSKTTFLHNYFPCPWLN